MKNKYKNRRERLEEAQVLSNTESEFLIESSTQKRAWWENIPMMWRVGLLALGAALLLFLPSIIAGEGIFLLVGDYNSQQIPFYLHCHEAIRSGNMGWDWYTDLGSNFITSYTFYLLGSPFFWSTLIFPTEWIPYLLGPLLMIKTSLCAAFAYGFLRRHTKTDGAAMIGALLYAFCGFAIYNIFFNHFHDVMVFFPLLLWSLDKLMEDNQRGIFALSVAACATVNYFFFFGEVVFVVIYYFMRLGYGDFPRKWRSFIYLCIEAVLGVGISMILLLPSVLAILQNDRLENYLSGTNMFVFGKARLLDIINSYIMPPQFTSQQVYFEGAATRWTSLSAYLPVFGLSGVLAYCGNTRRNWLKTLIVTLIVMSVVPILNSAFVAFNGSLYMRWYYMLVMMMTLATVKSLDELDKSELTRYCYVYGSLVIGALAVIWLSPNFSDGEFTDLGLYVEDNLIPLIVLSVFGVLGVVLLRYCLTFLKENGNRKKFFTVSACAVLVFSILFGNFYLFWGKSLAYSNGYVIDDVIKGEEVELDAEEGTYRIDSDNSLSNIGMFYGFYNVHCFHSIVPASIVSFYKYLGEERSVSSKIGESQYAVRALTAVRYYFDRVGTSTSFADSHDSIDTKMPGYTYVKTVNGYDIWENDYALPLAFKYDSYILEDEMEYISTSKRANAMLHGVMLTLEQAARFDGTILEEVLPYSSSFFTEQQYYDDCIHLRSNAVDSFVINQGGGFTIKTSYDSKSLVYISVPWEEGWSATVNGEEAHIEKVNVGFMAIVVPAGEAEVVFTYETPGLKIGAIVTGLSVCALGVYYFVPEWLKKWQAKNKNKKHIKVKL